MNARFLMLAPALLATAALAAKPKAGGTSGNPHEVDSYESRQLRIRLEKPAEWTPIDTGMNLRLGSMSLDNVADRFALNVANVQVPWVSDKQSLRDYLDEMYPCATEWAETSLGARTAFICKNLGEARIGALREAGQVVNLRLRYPGEAQYQRILVPILNSIQFTE